MPLQPSIILQDLVMPGIDGFDLIRQYRAAAALRQVPVIVLSSKDDPKLMADSFALGASAYVVKLPGKAELLMRLRHHAAGTAHSTTEGTP
jgi:two-component system chemotaxis family response regulator WspR